MTRHAQFGVRIPVAGVLSSPQAIRSSAIEAEAVGFDTLWVHDYLIWNKVLDSVHISCGSREAFEAAGPDYPPMFYESLTSLAYCAAVTERIRLGIAVLILPYREPLFTAKQIACIDDLSGGRLDLGIGQGAAKSTLNVDFEVLGVSRATKVSQTREHLEAMQAIWTEESPSHHGRFVNFDDATVYPKPRQQPHPPIWIGVGRQIAGHGGRLRRCLAIVLGHARPVPGSDQRSSDEACLSRAPGGRADHRHRDSGPRRRHR